MIEKYICKRCLFTFRAASLKEIHDNGKMCKQCRETPANSPVYVKCTPKKVYDKPINLRREKPKKKRNTKKGYLWS